MKRVCSVVLAMFFLINCNVFADDLNFESDKDGIIKALTKPKTKGIKIKTKGITTKTKDIKIVEIKGNKIVDKEITLYEQEPEQFVNLKIEFDVDSYQIRRESFGILQELGKALTSDKLKDKKIKINGHTDSDGSDKHNLNLSAQRANAVKVYLTGNFSIPETRLKVFGYGKEKPLVPNQDSKSKQINRRVEIVADSLGE